MRTARTCGPPPIFLKFSDCETKTHGCADRGTLKGSLLEKRPENGPKDRGRTACGSFWRAAWPLSCS
nr:hypothetical protein SHINE37_43341 [Rhizobiaceae bacterium]